MIQAQNVSKAFDGITAVSDISCEMKDSSVFGLIGSNGAGKSTFMRMMAGVLRPDNGSVEIDHENVYENPAVKERFFYISDDQHFLANATPESMKNFYAGFYSKFNSTQFYKLMKNFDLDVKRRIKTFSKGMKKQVSILLALSSGTDYIFCDETFDGLDPVARQAVKSLFAGEIADRGITLVIASHNLRELEDVCDHVGLLHRGGILFSRDLDDMKLGLHKLQCIFKEEMTPERFSGLEILSFNRRNSLYTITAKGTADEIVAKVNAMSPIFFELLPLSLEEIFISETEVFGYDVKKLIL